MNWPVVLGLLALIVIAWNAVPLVLLGLLPLPAAARVGAARSFLGSAAKGLVVLVPDFAAPLVVALALVFTPRDAARLPWLFRWWDNDVSINGDQAEGAPTYYAIGHDRRSFWARYVWLGWRNRASYLALLMGYRYKPGEKEDSQRWGDAATGRDHEGWCVTRCSKLYQLYMIRRVGAMCIRVNYGHKVWADVGNRPVAMVVNITFSMISWKGAAQ
jgi:hypothetical protein